MNARIVTEIHRRNRRPHWDASSPMPDRMSEHELAGIWAPRRWRVITGLEEREWAMPGKGAEMIGSDGSRIGRDENGSYMIAADGSTMRKGHKGSVMVAANGATLGKARRSDKG
jgi:hypothetical protein